MTDYEDDALEFARYNAALNLTPVELARVTFRRLDWRRPDLPETFDVIAGADIAYERMNFEPLLSLARMMLRPGGVFLLTDPGREIGRDFILLASSRGFSANGRPVPVTHRGVDMIVVLWELSRREES